MSVDSRFFDSRFAKREPIISFGTRGCQTVKPRIEQMLEDILEGLNAIGPRLDAIERELKEVKEIVRKMS